MKSVSCSQPPLWNDRLLFLRFNPSSFVSIFFPKDCISVNSNAAAWGFVGLVFFRENLEPCSSTGSWMPAATQPQPSQASLKTLRSLHWHCWATQRLTLGMYLNSSWNCLPSKLRKTGAELQDMARISQNLASWVGKWRMFHLQPGETLVTPELWKTDQGYCRNALTWQKPESQSCSQEFVCLPHLQASAPGPANCRKVLDWEGISSEQGCTQHTQTHRANPPVRSRSLEAGPVPVLLHPLKSIRKSLQ